MDAVQNWMWWGKTRRFHTDTLNSLHSAPITHTPAGQEKHMKVMVQLGKRVKIIHKLAKVNKDNSPIKDKSVTWGHSYNEVVQDPSWDCVLACLCHAQQTLSFDHVFDTELERKLNFAGDLTLAWPDEDPGAGEKKWNIVSLLVQRDWFYSFNSVSFGGGDGAILVPRIKKKSLYNINIPENWHK